MTGIRSTAAAFILLLGSAGGACAADHEPAGRHPPVYGIAPYFGPPSPDVQMSRLLPADPVKDWPSQPRERDARYYGFSFLHSAIESYAKQRNNVDPVTGNRRSR
jgi:hypothetical protein